MPEDVTSSVGTIGRFFHHSITIDEELARLPFKHGRVEGDASPSGIELSDQRLDGVTMIEDFPY